MSASDLHVSVRAQEMIEAATPVGGPLGLLSSDRTAAQGILGSFRTCPLPTGAHTSVEGESFDGYPLRAD